jgi:hypothetical protein
LDDRAADNWRTLLAIAEVADWTTKAIISLNKVVNVATDQDDEISVMLLHDIREVFKETNKDRLASTFIVDQLNDMEDRPWPGFSKGKGLSANIMAKLLKRYQIGPRLQHMPTTQTKEKGYRRDYFSDAWARYFPDDTDS